MLFIYVMDEDTFKKDDKVADTALSLSRICDLGQNPFQEWIPWFHKGKNAGYLLLRVDFIPDQHWMNQGYQ